MHRLLLIPALAIGVAAPAAAQEFVETETVRLRAEILADGLDHPWGMAQLPDGSILVTERSGALYRLSGSQRSAIANVPSVAAYGQGGLLDIAVDEEFETNRTIYFTWSKAAYGGAATALSSARLSQDHTRLENVVELFVMNRKSGTTHHYGSRIVLAPGGKLFVTLGDRGEADRAQDFSDHAGSVVRLNRDGSVPSDNPFLGRRDAAPELWSKGHRNPQGADWNASDNRLWIVEHGARGGDEINRPEAGANYGWPVISYGRHYSGQKIGIGTSAPGYEQPEWYWDPSIAPSGMAFYDADLIPEWNGDLLVGALKFRMLVRLDMEDGRIVAEEHIAKGRFGRIRDVRLFADGAVYLLTDEDNGKLIRLAPAE